MPTFEHNGVFSYKDEQKNLHLLYPVTTKDNVEGMDQVEQAISTAQTTADNAMTAATNAATAANAAKNLAEQVKKDIEEGGGVGGSGCVLKITFAAGFKGQTFTVSGGGESKTGTVPDNLIANVKVQNCNTKYTVSCTTTGGDAYSTKITTGAYFGQYTGELQTFTAILTVTTKARAVVKAKKGSLELSATANSSGKATFTLTSSGSYSVSATYDGVTSDTKSVNAANNGGNYTATLTFITLTVNADPGSNLTLTNGSTTKTGTTVGASTFYLPNTGNWVVTATLSGQTATETVNVTGYGSFTVTLAYYKYVGVKVTDSSNTNPESAVTYTEDAVGMSAGYAAWKDHPIFKKIKPCVVKNGVVQYYLNRKNMNQKEDGTAATINSTSAGDVMIEIPKLGYKMTTGGSNHFINVTDDPNAPGYCYRAHSLDDEGDCDKIYIGAYLGFKDGSNLYSLSGKSPSTDMTLTTARSAAQARGTGYQLVSFYPLTLLQCLYLIMFKNRHGQAALGKGYTGASAKINTGGTNAKAFCSGDTNSATVQMKFLGIEDFWGNLFWWIDGIFCDSSRNIKTAFKNFKDDGSGYPFSKSSGLSSNLGDWMKTIQGTNEGGFTIKAGGASATTGWADDAYLYAGYCAHFGGYWTYGVGAGPFRFYVYSAASSSSSHLGARLMYKHKKAA